MGNSNSHSTHSINQESAHILGVFPVRVKGIHFTQMNAIEPIRRFGNGLHQVLIRQFCSINQTANQILTVIVSSGKILIRPLEIGRTDQDRVAISRFLAMEIFD